MREYYYNYFGVPCHGYVKIKPSINITPVKVIYNNPATIVFWNDNTKTVVKCDKEDTYNKETGFLMCLGKKLYGNYKFFNMLNEFCYKED